MTRLIGWLGIQRALLLLGVVVLIATAPYAGGETAYSGWLMWPTLLAPALAPMLVFVLPLDMTMCGILMADRTAAERRRYRAIIILDLVLLIVLVAAWSPFFLDLVDS